MLDRDGAFDITATHTVSFVGFDGAPLKTQAVALFSAATVPVAETPEGYEFEGWDRPFDYGTENMTVPALIEKMPGPEPQPDDVLPIARMDASDAPSVPLAAAHADAAFMALAKTGDDVFFALVVETTSISGCVQAVAVATVSKVRRAHGA